MNEKLPNIHPGEILLEEFMKPLGITAYRVAKDIRVQQTRISEIIRGERGITLDTAMRFARYFGTTPEIWLNLQRRYDLEALRDINDAALYSDIHPFVASAPVRRRKAA